MSGEGGVEEEGRRREGGGENDKGVLYNIICTPQYTRRPSDLRSVIFRLR